MTDIHTPLTRSKNMRAIKGQNTKPEIIVRKALYAKGFRYRLHLKNLPGSPDIVLPRYRALIFVNGCFWHGHRCHLSKIPSTRPEFWLKKISENISRDLFNQNLLMDSKWRIAVIWECSIRGNKKLDFQLLISELENWLLDLTSKSIEISGKH
jgi:DNA mismatch endonuclease (patch repair protein)